MIDGLPVVTEAFPRTVRLVSTARLRPPVLERLVSADDAAALAEIEGATSERLLAESRGAEGIGRDEFLHGVPYANFVNAAFAYWKPRETNRFNAARGAWYAALDVETCIREVAWHMAEFLARSGELKGVVDYAEMFASMAGEFVDLRGTPRPPLSRSGPGGRLSDRQRDRRRSAGARAERDHLPVRAPCGRNLHRRPYGRTRCSPSRPAPSIGLEWSGDPEPAITAGFPSSGRYRRGGNSPANTACSVAPSLRLNSSASNSALTASVLSSRGCGTLGVGARGARRARAWP